VSSLPVSLNTRSGTSTFKPACRLLRADWLTLYVFPIFFLISLCSRETPLRYAGKGLAVFMDKTKNVPRFVWLMLSGLISQQMLSYMHGSSPSTKKSTSSTQQQKVSFFPLPADRCSLRDSQLMSTILILRIQVIHPAGSNEARAVADALRKRAAVAPKSDVRSEERAH
jgi:hypothetical protein